MSLAVIARPSGGVWPVGLVQALPPRCTLFVLACVLEREQRSKTSPSSALHCHLAPAAQPNDNACHWHWRQWLASWLTAGEQLGTHTPKTLRHIVIVGGQIHYRCAKYTQCQGEGKRRAHTHTFEYASVADTGPLLLVSPLECTLHLTVRRHRNCTQIGTGVTFARAN